MPRCNEEVDEETLLATIEGEASARKDLVAQILMLLFENHGIRDVPRDILHDMFATVLPALEKAGFKYKGFRRDATTRQYRAIEEALSSLIETEYISIPTNKQDCVHISIHPRIIPKILDDMIEKKRTELDALVKAIAEKVWSRP